MWALYGLVNALKATGDEQLYLPHIEGQLNLLLSHLRTYPVPDWDLNCFGEEVRQKDTSAAAILVCALLKLADLRTKAEMGGLAANYRMEAERILECLIRDFWAAPEKDNLIEGGQAGTESVGCVWGDYFMVEALTRKLHGSETPDFWV